jgi:hypothetical protein
VAFVEIDNGILEINSSKKRGHVGGFRHNSRLNVKLFKSIKFVLFVQKEKEEEKKRKQNIKPKSRGINRSQWGSEAQRGRDKQ